jgi:hypothetical protein
MSKQKTDQNPNRLRISNVVRKNKRALANWIGILFGKFSNRTQKVVFLLIFSVSGVYCITLLFGGGSGGIPHAGKIKQAILPEIVKKNTTAYTIRNKVIGLRNYLDSLSNTSDGRTHRDSILAKNPGLIDSLLIWEKQLELHSNK